MVEFRPTDDAIVVGTYLQIINRNLKQNNNIREYANTRESVRKFFFYKTQWFTLRYTKMMYRSASVAKLRERFWKRVLDVMMRTSIVYVSLPLGTHDCYPPISITSNIAKVHHHSVKFWRLWSIYIKDIICFQTWNEEYI